MRKLHPGARSMYSRAANQKRESGSSGHVFRWEVLNDGNDALLLSGKYSGKRLSELVESEDGRNYLGWVYQAAPDKLRNLIEGFFDG